MGLIKYYQDGRPSYKWEKPLNLPAKDKLLGRIGILLFCVVFIAVIASEVSFIRSEELKKSSEQKELNLLFGVLVLFCVISHFVPTICSLIVAYMNCYVNQYVVCKKDRNCVAYLYPVAHLLSWCFPWYLIFFNYTPPVQLCKIFIGFSALSTLLTVLAYIYAKKYCKCKKCQGIKDVNISYLDEILSMGETDKITVEVISTHFRISVSSDERLGIFENKKRIYSFVGNASIQLHEGNYVIQKRILSEEVKISYNDLFKNIAVSTKFNEKQLRIWLDIDTNGIIAIQSEDGKMVHTFYEKEEMINLNEGNYNIRIVNIEPNPSKPIDVSINVENEEKLQDCTILTVD